MKNLFKIFFLCVAVAFCVACDGEQGAGGSTELPSLQLTVDKTVVQANSDDYVTVTVTGKNGVITDGLMFVDKKTNKTLQIEDGKFYPKKAGEYEFMASDGNGISNYVKVAAIDFPVPALPQEDEADTARLAFNKKVLIVQFTSVACTACPTMKTVLKLVGEDARYASRFVLASSHHDMNGVEDPASYREGSSYEVKMLGSPTYPKLVLDYFEPFQLYLGQSITDVVSSLQTSIDKFYKEGIAAVGIAVNSLGSNTAVVARVKVKVGAKTDSKWYVGAMLLQDGINARQEPTKEMMVHDNCIRAIDAGAGFYGYSLGRLPVGSVMDHTFTFTDLLPNVKVDDCKLLIFVTCNNVVQNAIVAPIGENVGYDYAL